MLLARYAGLLRHWLGEAAASPSSGLWRPDSPLGIWERQSKPLGISSAQQDAFARFADEVAALGRSRERVNRFLASARLWVGCRSVARLRDQVA